LLLVLFLVLDSASGNFIRPGQKHGDKDYRPEKGRKRFGLDNKEQVEKKGKGER